MKVLTIKNIQEFRALRKNLGEDVGLVPTMGNLHLGHLSLIESSLKNHKTTVVSIFVNPLQFGPNEDFDKYPRTLEADENLIKNLSATYPDKEIIILAPKDPKEMYPSGFQTSIDVKEISKPLCGKNRPGHFSGVATVVYKLFMLAKPLKAYFGQKDYQQVSLIRRMVIDLDLTVEIITGKIIRDQKGLALSSRNQYLTETDYQEGLTLPKSINLIKDSLPNYKETLENILKSHPHFDYLEVRDAQTLEEINSNTLEVVIAGAYKVGKTRLIDNQIADWKATNA